MIKLTQVSLAKRPRKEREREFIFVEFNAWLYQGYDDARAALMDVIATKLEAEAKLAGADAFMTKPFAPMELLDLVGELMPK